MAEPAGPESRRVRRGGLLVAGPDAHSWLQGQLTQDLDPMGDGDSRLTLVLSPQGKVESFCRVSRRSPEAFLLDVEDGFAAALAERLRRFKLRVKVELTPIDVVAELRREGGFDALGPPETDGGKAEGDADDDWFESARIIAGVPRLGRELTGDTIPQEAGDELVERTVSFTKGCYTGQELVARLDARGSNVPRRLRLLSSSSPVARPPRAGDPVEVDEADAGRVTSAARLPAGGVVALAFVKRKHLAHDRLSAEVVTAEGRLPVIITPPGRRGGRE